jgi:hypothetical protein
MRVDMTRVPARRANTCCVALVVNYDLRGAEIFSTSFVLNGAAVLLNGAAAPS